MSQPKEITTTPPRVEGKPLTEEFSLVFDTAKYAFVHKNEFIKVEKQGWKFGRETDVFHEEDFSFENKGATNDRLDLAYGPSMEWKAVEVYPLSDPSKKVFVILCK